MMESVLSSKQNKKKSSQNKTVIRIKSVSTITTEKKPDGLFEEMRYRHCHGSHDLLMRIKAWIFRQRDASANDFLPVCLKLWKVFLLYSVHKGALLRFCVRFERFGSSPAIGHFI